MTSSAMSIVDEPELPRWSTPADTAAAPQTGESFDRFYIREYSKLVALAHVLTGSRAHAEDIAQEAMLAAYQKWDTVRHFDVPVAWVRRVCANLSTSLIRRRIVEARAMLRLRTQPSPVAKLDVDDGAFWAAVRRLPTRQAQCIALAYIYDCSVADIAGVLDCAEGTVKSHLSRGRSRLAKSVVEVSTEVSKR